jgi:hypothetical protein
MRGAGTGAGSPSESAEEGAAGGDEDGVNGIDDRERVAVVSEGVSFVSLWAA